MTAGFFLLALAALCHSLAYLSSRPLASVSFGLAGFGLAGGAGYLFGAAGL